MIKFLRFALLFLSLNQGVFSQVVDRMDFQSPLEIPLLLSGNFAELRSSHFHAGIDIKTQGVTGKNVLAPFDGYVSRVKIQSGGYGRSLYITHPNGYTTVYGHLDSYMPELQKYITEQQYSKKSYELDIYPASDNFPVKKGEVVAKSGNTGRSGGPHLHFEIRKSSAQIPQNVLKYGLPVQDNIAPEFRGFYTYLYKQHEPNGIQQMLDQYPLVKQNDSSYVIEKVLQIEDAYLGFGTEVYDFLDGSSNKCGVYSLELRIDEKLLYSFRIDELPFSKTKYINAHMDYGLKKNEQKSVHRLFLLPHNQLNIYNRQLGNGIYSLADFNIHQAVIVATDAYGNKSKISFSFQRKPMLDFNYVVPDIGYLIEWDKGRMINKNNLQLEIPARALYQDVNLHFDYIEGMDLWHDTLIIHHPDEPLHKNIIISLEIDSVPDDLSSKLMLASVNGDNKLNGAGGNYANGSITLSTRSFGKYVVVADTTSPEIKIKSFSPGQKYSAGQKLAFTLSDDLSGLSKYAGYIDGAWVLCTFDAKSGSLEYTIDSARIEAGKEHTLRIEVEDGKKNVAIYEAGFYY